MIDLELYNELLHANHFTVLDSYVKESFQREKRSEAKQEKKSE